MCYSKRAISGVVAICPRTFNVQANRKTCLLQVWRFSLPPEDIRLTQPSCFFRCPVFRIPAFSSLEQNSTIQFETTQQFLSTPSSTSRIIVLSSSNQFLFSACLPRSNLTRTSGSSIFASRSRTSKLYVSLPTSSLHNFHAPVQSSTSSIPLSQALIPIFLCLLIASLPIASSHPKRT